MGQMTMMKWMVVTVVLATAQVSSAAAGQSDFPMYFPNTTAKVCQLTGDFDRSLQKPIAYGAGGAEDGDGLVSSGVEVLSGGWHGITSTR